MPDALSRTLVLTALAGAVAVTAAYLPFAPSADEAAVRAALQHYLDGAAAGQREVSAKAFHPAAHLTWVQDGQLRTRSLEAYLSGFRGTPAPDEAQRKRWVESVDIAGDAAIGKIILDYPTVRFTDYMSLLRVDGEWKIIHKSFQSERK